MVDRIGAPRRRALQWVLPLLGASIVAATTRLMKSRDRCGSRSRPPASSRPPKHPVVRAWLADNPRIYLHFTSIGGSWTNQVETWFSIVERRPSRAASFAACPP